MVKDLSTSLQFHTYILRVYMSTLATVHIRASVYTCVHYPAIVDWDFGIVGKCRSRTCSQSGNRSSGNGKCRTLYLVKHVPQWGQGSHATNSRLTSNAHICRLTYTKVHHCTQVYTIGQRCEPGPRGGGGLRNTAACFLEKTVGCYSLARQLPRTINSAATEYRMDSSQHSD